MDLTSFGSGGFTTSRCLSTMVFSQPDVYDSIFLRQALSWVSSEVFTWTLGHIKGGKAHPDTSLCTFLCSSPQPRPRGIDFLPNPLSIICISLFAHEEKTQTDKQGGTFSLKSLAVYMILKCVFQVQEIEPDNRMWDFTCCSLYTFFFSLPVFSPSPLLCSLYFQGMFFLKNSQASLWWNPPVLL